MISIISVMQSVTSYFKSFAVVCSGDFGFFQFPTWYKYLPGTCADGLTLPEKYNIVDGIPLILLAVFEIALRIAGLVAVIFVVYGGVTYVISQGEPDKVAQAKGTIINALVGLLIATFAVAIVSFIGNQVG